ncbi:ferredoxin [Streptomyces sp. NPDC093252]|uniref:ferredoxin n=1 Tax=Streptomyces sp. NPDC093252 TaxID=3154980 RepID=UPI003423DF7F
MTTTTVSIDPDHCIGAGNCYLTAPGVFDQDEDGFGTVRPGRADGGGDPLLREAARGCPAQAISVREE